MAGGYSEDEFVSRLARLTMAQEAISGLSHWILSHQASNGDSIVKTWIKTLLAENEPARMTMFMYVANDVIQNGRKKCPEFQGKFFTVLEPAFKCVGRVHTKETEKCLARLLDIWRKRAIYSEEKLARLEAALKSGKKRAGPVDPAAINAPRSPKEKLHHHHHALPRKPSHSIPYDAEQMRRTIQELKEVLVALHDPPSTNENIRSTISSYPEFVGNVEKLSNLRNEEEARVVQGYIAHAEPVVKEYCKSLSQEVMDRRNLKSLLSEFLGQLRASSDRYVESVQWLKQRVDKLQKEKLELQVAYDSLPDLSETPMEFGELPTFESLFKPSRSS